MAAIHCFTGGGGNGLGAELTIDGTSFTNGATYWTPGADWAFGSLRANYGPAGSGGAIYQDITPQSPGVYRLEFTIAAGSGSVYATLVGTGGDVAGTTRTGIAAYSEDITVPSGSVSLTRLRFNGSGSAAVSINNVSLKQVY